jgi:hypothetical protein
MIYEGGAILASGRLHRVEVSAQDMVEARRAIAGSLPIGSSFTCRAQDQRTVTTDWLQMRVQSPAVGGLS